VTRVGYTMMTEQSRPDRLVRDVARAEKAGFDFSVCSDHFQPWLEEQGHSGYAWSILGAAAQATERIGLMTSPTPSPLVQIGEDQQDGFIGWAERELLPALRSIG
jgi:alkanesulfonate monooxygenase SsuD/methylene tetrahydromethanopterin reductase-like flavin-dependent oxidoreductase (luciferase family)